MLCICLQFLFLLFFLFILIAVAQKCELLSGYPSRSNIELQLGGYEIDPK